MSKVLDEDIWRESPYKKFDFRQNTWLILGAVLVFNVCYHSMRSGTMLGLTMDKNIDRDIALHAYTSISTGLLIGYVIGALLGDLFTGVKRALYIAVVLFAVSASGYLFNTNLFLNYLVYLLGAAGGIFSINAYSHLLHSVLDVKKSLRTLLFYALSVDILLNIGSSLGITAGGMIGETYSWDFSTLALICLVPFSAGFIYFTEFKKAESFAINSRKQTQRGLIFSTALFLAFVVFLFFIQGTVSEYQLQLYQEKSLLNLHAILSGLLPFLFLALLYWAKEKMIKYLFVGLLSAIFILPFVFNPPSGTFLMHKSIYYAIYTSLYDLSKLMVMVCFFYYAPARYRTVTMAFILLIWMLTYNWFIGMSL